MIVIAQWRHHHGVIPGWTCNGTKLDFRWYRVGRLMVQSWTTKFAKPLIGMDKIETL